MYDDAMQAIVNNLIRTSRNGLIYTTDLKYGYIDHSMDHLACFAGKFNRRKAKEYDDSSESRAFLWYKKKTKFWIRHFCAGEDVHKVVSRLNFKMMKFT